MKEGRKEREREGGKEGRDEREREGGKEGREEGAGRININKHRLNLQSLFI